MVTVVQTCALPISDDQAECREKEAQKGAHDEAGHERVPDDPGTPAEKPDVGNGDHERHQPPAEVNTIHLLVPGT